jgi:AcrR family transcriptional regulator
MTRQRSDEQRKLQIRAAATRCFVRRGFAATRLQDIAREAGLSKGGVYFHYRAKEQLFHEILDQRAEALRSRWAFEPVADQPPERTLSKLVLAQLQTMEGEPDDARLFFLLVAMASQQPLFRDKLEELLTVMRELYAAVIRRGMEVGVFAPGDAEALARTLVALVQGLGAQSVVDPQGRLPVEPRVTVEQVLRLVGHRPTAVGHAHPAAAAAHGASAIEPGRVRVAARLEPPRN